MIGAISVAGKSVGMQGVDGKRVGHRIGSARHRGARMQRAIGAALDEDGLFRRPLALARDDLHDAAHGVGTIERGLRSAQHLDAFDVAQRQRAKIEGAIGAGGIADTHAIDQHERLTGIRAAQSNVRC